MTIVAGLSADYEIEVPMLDNNPTGLETTKVERILWGISITGFSGNIRTQRLYRHRKKPPRRIVERRTGDPATDSRVPASAAEGRVTALRTA